MEKIVKAIIIYLLVTSIAIAIWAPGASAESGSFQDAISAYNAGDFDKALDGFIHEYSFTRSPIAALYMGLLFKKTNRYEDAILYLEESAYNAGQLPPEVYATAYVELADALVQTGDPKKAIEYITYGKSKWGIKNPQLAYLEGQCYVALGEKNNAMAFFKEAEKDSSLKNAALMQEATVLAMQGKTAAARQAFKSVIQQSPGTDYAEFSRYYESALKSPKRLFGTLGISYLYDSNVISKPLDSAAANGISGEKDGSVLSSLNFTWTPDIRSEKLFLTAQGGFSANNHFKVINYDAYTAYAVVTPSYGLSDTATLSLPISYTYAWFDNRGYLSQPSVGLSARKTFGTQYILDASLSYANRNILRPPYVPDENRNADVYTASLSWYWIPNDKTMLNVKYDYAIEDAKGVNWQNHGNFFTVSFLRSLSRRFKGQLWGSLADQRYDHIHSIIGIRREDRPWSAGAGLTYDLPLKGYFANKLSLFAQYAHYKSDSNIHIYNYVRDTYMVGTEIKF